METITTIIGLGLSLYLASKIYSAIFKVTLKNEFNIKEITGLTKTQTGWGVILIPFTALLAFLFNIGNSIVWFIGEILGWVVNGVMWIYEQVIVAGLFLLLRVLWHYLIVWPWNLIKLSFSQIMPSLDKSQFIMALKGLFYACLIAFTGRFLTEHYQTSAILENFFTLISLLPIGWTAGQIALASSKSKMDSKEFRQRYTRHALFVMAFILVIAGGMWLLINLGSRGSFAYTLSSLFIGGTLIGSAFLILAALLFVFTLSALPSFSRDYQGDYKGFPAAFGNHIYHKGTRYLIALPAMLIPAILLTIIPYYLSKGFAFTGAKVTDNVYENRIKDVQASLAKDSIPTYDAWQDFRKINDDSLKKLIAADQKLIDLKSQLEVLYTNNKYLRDFYGSNSDSIGAAPAGAAIYLFNSYSKQQKERINIRSYEKIAVDTQAFANEIMTSNESAKVAKSNVDNQQKYIDDLNAQLGKVCVVDSGIAPNQQNTPATNDTTAVTTQTPDTRDDCQKQRDYYTSTIASATKVKSSLDSQYTRSKMVNEHIKSMRARLNTMQSNRNISSLLGHFLATAWYSLLMAFAFAFALVLFARVNNEIYMQKDKSSSWMVMDEIENAKSSNPNQPLMGLGILSVLAFATLFYLDSPSNWNPMNWDLGLHKPCKTECSTKPESSYNQQIQDSTNTSSEEVNSMPAVQVDSTSAPAIETEEVVPVDLQY
ncbi:MAG: hypothetical protein RLZZ161_772 [Bacteroidota bacterium]